MADHDTWHWQEPRTAWKGAGLYHITLTKTPCHPPRMCGWLVMERDAEEINANRRIYGREIDQ